MPAAIETQDLTRRFGERTAVDHVSMTVPERSIYGFLGRNGAGKTTTIRLLLGLLKADAGSVRIAGIDIASRRREAARKVGVLLEAHGMYPHLNGRENLDLCRRLLDLPTAEIDRVLAMTDMARHAQQRVGGYSLGMRQRLGLARALLGAPPVLILDEPTNGLDPEGIADMRGFLRELPERSGATVLVSSHLLGEIEQVATHVGIISNGCLVLEGALRELKATMSDEVEIGTDAPERTIAVAREHGVAVEPSGDSLVARFPPGQDARSAIVALNQALCLAGIQVHALVPRHGNLETLYRQAAHAAPSATAT